MKNEALQKAINAAGSQTKLARLLGKYPQLVQAWTQNGLVPAHWVVPIEKATGVSREELRPDLYKD